MFVESLLAFSNKKIKHLEPKTIIDNHVQFENHLKKVFLDNTPLFPKSIF